MFLSDLFFHEAKEIEDQEVLILLNLDVPFWRENQQVSVVHLKGLNPT